MIPGELIPASGEITLNEGVDAIILMVANTGDRPVQVGSHYHFDIAAGTAVRFEPGQSREVNLIPIAGDRRIYGFNQQIMGDL